MKTVREIIQEAATETTDKETFHVVMLGGSIGTTNVRKKSDLKGLTANPAETFVGAAEVKAKRMNKQLSPGERKYYNIKFIVARAVNGKFTGK